MKIRSETIKDFTIIFLNGRMDISFVEAIEDEFLEILASTKTKNLIMDITDVDYLSSSAIRIFANSIKFSKEKNIRLVVTGMSQSVEKIFELVEMKSMFEVRKNNQEAIKHFS
ncbi:MAG: STAS domain-containing protein [Spirochaetota bacterium]